MELELKLRAELAPAKACTGHPAIQAAIELPKQSAQDLADCVSIDGAPDWVQEPEAKIAFDGDIAAATALVTVQAEIEVPLLARIKVLEGSLRTSVADFNLPPHPDTRRLDLLISSGLQVHEACGKFRLREVMDGHAIGKCHDSARAALDAGLAESAEALPILRLLADDTEGGAGD